MMMHVKQWSSRAVVMLHSVLSWMHWRRRAKEKRRLELEELLRRAEDQALRNLRILLWEALQPASEAMHRLDQNQQQNQRQTHKHLQYQEELLKEILNSLQPPARQLISRQIGPHPLRITSPDLES